jgi:hypothetical protein
MFSIFAFYYPSVSLSVHSPIRPCVYRPVFRLNYLKRVSICLSVCLPVGRLTKLPTPHIRGARVLFAEGRTPPLFEYARPNLTSKLRCQQQRGVFYTSEEYLSIYLSIYLSMALQSFVATWPLFQFPNPIYRG